MAGDISRENGKKGGRKRGYKAIQAEKAREFLIREVMKEFGPIIAKQIELAKAGDNKAIEYLINQSIGKPKETVEHQGEMSLKLDV